LANLSVKTELSLRIDQAFDRFIKCDYKRVVFVANNPNISDETSKLINLDATDVLVQFNKALFFDVFSSFLCYKVHVFNANGEGSYWGFDREGLPQRDYTRQAASELMFLFTSWLSDGARLYLNSISDVGDWSIMYKQWEPSLYIYPAKMKPSVGFQAVSYFNVVNLLRVLHGKERFKLELVGFTGVYPPGAAWALHDFTFEQKVYETWLDLVRRSCDGCIEVS